MATFRNASNLLVPVREQRIMPLVAPAASPTLAPFAAVNNELVIDVNGDANVMFFGNSSAFIGTLEFSGSCDGSVFFPILAFPHGTACQGSSLPLAGQPTIAQALVAATTTCGFNIPCGQLRKVRVRVSNYTSGTLQCLMIADPNPAHSLLVEQAPATLVQSVTGALNATVTATLPAVAGLRHVIHSISVTRSAGVALTPTSTPVVVTTTNLGAIALTFGSDAGGVGVDVEKRIECSPTGLLASAIGTASTIVCPAWTGVTWRINVIYRLVL